MTPACGARRRARRWVRQQAMGYGLIGRQDELRKPKQKSIAKEWQQRRLFSPPISTHPAAACRSPRRIGRATDGCRRRILAGTRGCTWKHKRWRRGLPGVSPCPAHRCAFAIAQKRKTTRHTCERGGSIVFNNVPLVASHFEYVTPQLALGDLGEVFNLPRELAV